MDPAGTSTPLPAQAMCADSIGRALLAMAVPPEQRRDGVLSHTPVLGRHSQLPVQPRRAALAADAVKEAVPVAWLEHLDADVIAQWITDHHQFKVYPAVVLGSPHGAAVHLAVACGAAWLPTSFTVTAPWPGGSPADWVAAMARGTRLAERIMARNPGITVRQVHDPGMRGPLCGTTVSLHVRWRTLPTAYRTFMRSRVIAGGASILVRDLRTWPVLGGPPGYTFQIGTPAGGWCPPAQDSDNDAFSTLVRRISIGNGTAPEAAVSRNYAETSGEPALELQLRQTAAQIGAVSHRVLYTDPQAFSASVAGLYRAWLRPKPGDSHAVVSTGRMTDPWQVLDGGMVPYWCESSTRAVVDAAELWLAGSRPYDRISVLPEPPGTVHEQHASLTQWRSLAAFARRGGTVDPVVADRYPMLPTAADYASTFLRQATTSTSRPEPIPVGEAMRHLAQCPSMPGLMVA